MLHRRPLLGLVTAVYLAVVGWVTLGPQPVTPDADGWLWRLLNVLGRHDLTDWITYSRLEFTANIAMFLPLGLFLLLLFGRRFWPLAIVLCCALTVGIETAQLFIPTRVSDLRDVVANSAGGALGVLLGMALTLSSRAAPSVRMVGGGPGIRTMHDN
jgi:glycopeptide antibiotics resistance protein